MKKIIIYLFLTAFIFFSFNLTSKFVIADNDYWYRVWGGIGHDECVGIALDSSNNVYLGGTLEMFSDPWRHNALHLVKYDNSGNYQWNKTINGTSYRGGTITLDSSDYIFLAGEIYNPNSSTFDFILIKFDPLGNYQWNKTWDSGNDDVCYTIALDSLENIYLAGSSFTEPNNEDFCLVKYDKLGNYQWNRTWGGGNSFEDCNSILIDPSENLYLAGTKGDQYCIVVYDTNGTFQWTKSLKIGKGGIATGVVRDINGNIYIGGSVFMNTASENDFLLIKNLQLFTDQQISGYNIFFLTMTIGILSFVILLKTNLLKNKKN